MITQSTSKNDILLSGLLTSAAALMTFLFLAIGHHLPPDQGELGVVFPPWTSEAEAVSAIVEAGGALAGGTRVSNIIVAVASDPGFAQRVRDNGAWLTTAARGLCGQIEGEQA